MIDSSIASCHEDPEAMSDYHDAAGERDVCEVLTDSLARSMIADLRTEDGQPIGEGVLTETGYSLTRQLALDAIADDRLVITLAEAVQSDAS